jgi:hypothetical protein
MVEVTIRNKEVLKLLDETIEMFLVHETLMTDMSNRLTPDNPDDIKYTREETLKSFMDNKEHIGFPEQGYAFQVSYGVKYRPEIFEPLMKHAKFDLPRMLGAFSNALTSYYPKGGFVGWHTNWNASGYQLVLSWSESGDGYFSYYDNKTKEIVTLPDKKGWNARWYRFGRKGEPDHVCWHSAWTNCPRFTLAFRFPYKGGGEFDALQDLVEEIEFST